ncbi:MAG: cytochrome c1 [Pseudomonadota bacterium]
MKKTIATFLLALLPGLATAAGGGEHLEEVSVNIHDEAALQRGAKLFSNYCLSCHSVEFQRWRRTGEDLGLSQDQVEKKLMPGDEGTVNDMMDNVMPAEQSENWFGTTPPDLSVVARSRGEDWLYSYLKGFYLDDTRPFGVNNTVFDLVGMPHALWELEGLKKPITETHTNEDGEEEEVVVDFEYVVEGSMTESEYDRAVRDIVTFLSYVGEPARLERFTLGVWVIGFLAVLLVFAYFMKREFWKDIH